jgi:hypothetical protein
MKNKNKENSNQNKTKKETIREKVARWKTEVESGRHDGWVTEYFRQKIEKIKRNLNVNT